MARIRHAMACALVAAAALAGAQRTPIRADGARVVVYEVPVLAFKAAQSGATPETRAILMADRLMQSAGGVAVSATGKSRRLSRGKTTLTIVSPEDASAAGTGVESLSQQWADNLNEALALPPLKLSEPYLRIPVGETRTVKLVGSKAHLVQAASSDYKVASAQRTSEGLVVKALSAGQASLPLTAGDATATLNVEVWPTAAPLPQQLQASVTGIPASADTVRGAIEGALRTQLKGIAGAKWSFEVGEVPEVEVGESRTFEVKVRAEAAKSFPAQGIANVVVKNLAVPRRIEGELWYCNDPESLKKPGPLFSSNLLKDAPVRLLYHHVNDSSYPLYVRVQVVNDTDQSARIVLMPGDSKPDANPVLAGLLAADQFMRSWMTNSGEVATIPPHSSLPVSIRRLAPTETMSGLCALRLLPGGPDSVLVRADAIPPFDPDPRWTAALQSPAPWRIVGSPKLTHYDQAPTVVSSHIYPNPYKQEELNYEVGGRYGFVRIGQKPIARADQVQGLDGNFGVLYTIRASATNPTQEPAEVEVVFEASAGYAGALFVVNGQMKRTFPLAPKTETQLARFQLEPGATKNLTLVTIPHSGGSYPATVTLRPVRDAANQSARR